VVKRRLCGYHSWGCWFVNRCQSVEGWDSDKREGEKGGSDWEVQWSQKSPRGEGKCEGGRGGRQVHNMDRGGEKTPGKVAI